jgi:phage terminase large subunit-like protein
LISVPGPTIRFGWVAEELIRLSLEFDIVVIGYDRWRIDDFKADLDDADASFSVPLEPFGQGFKEMGPAVEWLSEIVVTERLRHGGHPVMNAAIGGAVAVKDPAGNLKIDKDKSSKGPVRVDGAVTLAMALELWRRVEPEPPPADINDFLKHAVVA